ncbi:MAG: hypothetical protein ACOCTS_00360 [Thermodesulfobacteriota bacterium]
MIIDREQVEKLANYQNINNPVVNVYLNVTPPRNVSSELNSMIHTTLRTIEQDSRYTEEQVKGLKKVMDRVEDYIQKAYKRTSGTRLVALFADAADRTLDFFKRKHFTRLILGGLEDKTLPQLRDHLHSYLKNRLAAEFTAHPDNHLSEIKEKALSTYLTECPACEAQMHYTK